MKTTNKQFEIFVDECKLWIERFGLKEYRIEFFCDEYANGARGMTEDYDNLMAMDIYFPKKLDKSTNNNKIKKAAFHEICEVLLMRLRVMGNKYFNFELVDKEVHTVIRKMENNIFDILNPPNK